MSYEELLTQYASLCRDEGSDPRLQTDHIHQGKIAQTVSGLRYFLRSGIADGEKVPENAV